MGAVFDGTLPDGYLLADGHFMFSDYRAVCRGFIERGQTEVQLLDVAVGICDVLQLHVAVFSTVRRQFRHVDPGKARSSQARIDIWAELLNCMRRHLGRAKKARGGIRVGLKKGYFAAAHYSICTSTLNHVQNASFYV